MKVHSAHSKLIPWAFPQTLVQISCLEHLLCPSWIAHEALLNSAVKCFLQPFPKMRSLLCCPINRLFTRSSLTNLEGIHCGKANNTVPGKDFNVRSLHGKKKTRENIRDLSRKPM